MASKKAGRLAGLAALAGLAYMNKDKLFGAKGETKAETKAETKVKDTAAEDAKAAAKRDAAEETMGYTSSGNAAMYEKEPGFETKITPAKVASPSASVAKTPIVGGPNPARDPGGAGKRGAVSAGPTPARDPGGAGKRGAVSAGPNPARAPGGAGKRGGASSEAAANMMDLPPYRENPDSYDMSMKRGGKVKKMASGGTTSSASKRGDGIATKGKTRGRMC